jgi:DNA-binding transcriptional ArsR family regulator
MSAEPRVRDFTSPPRTLPVWVEASPLYEFLLGLFSYQASHAPDGVASDHSTFVERIDVQASADVKRALGDLSGCGGLWLTLLGIARTAPQPHTVDGFVSTIADLDPISLRRQMLRNAGITPSRGFSAEDIDNAAGGDVPTLDRLLNGGEDDLHSFLARGAEETQRQLVDLMRRVAAEVDLGLDEVMPALERDATATRAMAASLEPADLVEKVTNGVTFEPRAGLRGIVLIPSVVIHPWVVISEHDDVRIFSYPVSDEHLNADPAAPPSHLIEVYKALGDERRLRILYLLSTEARSLGELAEKLDLAKSTAHHHLRTLRQAGLVRVIVGDDDKKYELRRSAVPEAGTLLAAYIEAAGQTRPTTSERI